MLTEIVIRVPATYQVEYGCASYKQSEDVRRMVDRIAQAKIRLHANEYVEGVKETDTSVLRAAAAELPKEAVQGSLSGQASDRIAVSELRGLPSQL